jgi:hypothetical protein
MISVAKLVHELGYDNSPNFVAGSELGRVPGYGHIFRRAQRRHDEDDKSCGLQGVYILRQWPGEDVSLGEGSVTPVVYVCEAESDAAAERVHRLVWNQDVVPFVIVRTPQNVHVYSGFGYREDENAKGKVVSRILREAVAAQDITAKLASSFHAEHIDDGALWREKGQFVTPDMRVDWRLLDRLKELGRVLRKGMRLPVPAAHALIGKYVYLRYLRDRNILSDERFDLFKINARTVFTRNAQLAKLRLLVDKLDDWLNGSVFDIPWGSGVAEEHVQKVAGAFFGDDPKSGQGSLFEDYDFSYVPIETLSVVYEQFLHAEGKGKDAGAYYTPIPLVNFILDEMEARRPFTKGMRALDPACGSGAFLVQCYRRLVEKELLKRKGEKFRPGKLRELLQDHIFGVDRDEDACQMTELSLILTLLDYVDPPDLSNTNFKLPKLRGTNIFGGPANDFFVTGSEFHQKTGKNKFDWVVGNPPWIEVNDEKPRPKDSPARDWRDANAKKYPTGGNQVAELFAWKVTEHVDAEGSTGLLLPAMTLFKDESTRFRKAFFASVKVSAVVNFANLAYVLFAGRSKVPAAAFFYQKRFDAPDAVDEAERILTFAPLVTNQEPNRPTRFNRKVDTWTVTINGSELREVAVAEAIRGDALTWKVAMWGSYRDRRLLGSVGHRFQTTLAEEGKNRGLEVHSGFEPRKSGLLVQELVGKKRIRQNAMRGVGHLFVFADSMLEPFPEDLAHARPGRDDLPVVVSRPPHILCDAARRFAVFSDKFIVVRPGQPAIAGPNSEIDFLKVLSLYLSSDFARYCEYLTSPRWGISISVSTVKTLKALRLPLASLSAAEFDEWLDLHARLVAALPTQPRKKARSKTAPASSKQKSFAEMEEPQNRLPGLVDELNDRVYKLLRLRKSERMLVEDFVQVKAAAIQGKYSEKAAGRPDEKELIHYAEVLQAELDGFFEDNPRLRHRVEVLYDKTSRTGMVDVELVKNPHGPLPVSARPVDDATSADFRRAQEQARRKHGQWLYFQRNLRVYKGSRVLLLKPLERLHWLRSQALLDADTIIAEKAAGVGK